MTKKLYNLPFKDATIRAVSDSRVHKPPFEHAIDFILPIGTPIIAAADGVVCDLKGDSKIGGPDPKYIADANYVTIKHPNGEYSQYVHLDAVCVAENQPLKVGEIIGASGNTGFSTEPHLHFMVFRLAKNTLGWKCAPINFKAEVVVNRF